MYHELHCYNLWWSILHSRLNGKSWTYSLPWKIPCEVDSTIVGGLTSTIKDEGVSNQQCNTVWGDFHIFKTKGCKIETKQKKSMRPINHFLQSNGLNLSVIKFGQKDNTLTQSPRDVHWLELTAVDHGFTDEQTDRSFGAVGNLESHLWIPGLFPQNLICQRWGLQSRVQRFCQYPQIFGDTCDGHWGSLSQTEMLCSQLHVTYKPCSAELSWGQTSVRVTV